MTTLCREEMDYCSFGAVYFDVAYFSHGVLCHLVYEA